MRARGVALLSGLMLLVLTVAGCTGQAALPNQAPAMTTEPAPAAQKPAEPAQPVLPSWVTPVTDADFEQLLSKHRPNELGLVLILEYHDFKDVEERWARRWDNFRGDLEMLYARGYRAVNLLDYLKGEMALPAGTSPVIFTFDDSLLSQVKLEKQDGKWVAAADSAVGVMLQFKQEHPDFGAAGTFYINFTPVPFRERENWKEKIHFLVEHSFEVANHAQYHEDLGSLSDAEVQEALGMQVKRLQEALPDYDGSTLALPFGISPTNAELALRGEHEGTRYNHRAVLLVGSDPVMSPYDKRLDVMALPRVQAIDSEFERWMPYLDRVRYISDGDPATIVLPEPMHQHLNLAKAKDKIIRTYKPPE